MKEIIVRVACCISIILIVAGVGMCCAAKRKCNINQKREYL